MTTYYLLSESQVLIPAAPRWLQEVSTICVSLSGIRNPLGPQWQPDTTGVVITPLQHIHIAMPHNHDHGYVALHIDNRGQPACWSLMGLGWGCPIDCVDSVIVSIFLSLHEPSQQTRVAIMSLLRQKDVVTSFWHDNDIIITSCVCWDGGAWGTHRWYFKSNKPVNCQLIIITCTFFLEWMKSCSISSGNSCFQLLINLKSPAI